MGWSKTIANISTHFRGKIFWQSLILRVQTDVQSLIFWSKNPCAKLILGRQHHKLAKKDDIDYLLEIYLATKRKSHPVDFWD